MTISIFFEWVAQPPTTGSRTMELTHVEKKKTCLHMVDVDVTIVIVESPVFFPRFLSMCVNLAFLNV